jgi:alanyl-tRNA synthetase
MREQAPLQVLRWRRGERSPEHVQDGLALSGEAFEIIVSRTPFYATSGGQVADSGVFTSDDFIWRLTDVRKEDRRIVHTAVLLQHPAGLRTWQDLVAWLQQHGGLQLQGTVEEDVRGDTRRNHTATHILHAALKKLIGAHVQQAGSLVAPDRLRFDFSHFKALTDDELRGLEREINAVVLANLPVETVVRDYEDAIASGAVAMFGEKYESRVRVVSVGDYSTELCGGTHVQRSGDIGLFLITSESSIASGVRRLEALTGRGAEQYVAVLRQAQRAAAQLLGLGPGQDAVQRVRELQQESRRLRRELDEARAQLAGGHSQELVRGAIEVDGTRVISARVEVADVQELRDLADAVRRELQSGAAVISAEVDDKIVFMATVTDDLVQRGVKAGDLVRHVAQITGGGGGGKPHMAQAGGRDKSKWQQALDEVVPLVRSKL